MKNLKFILVVGAILVLASGQVVAQSTTMKKYGEDSISCFTHTSLYREFYKQKNYADALPHWRWVFNNCPLASQNIYIDGAKMMASKINDAKDQKTRNAYIDTLLMVYDKRIKCFGDSPTSRSGMVWGREGIELDNYRPSDTMRVYQFLSKSVETEGINSEAIVVARYFINVNNLVKNHRFPTDSIVELYDRLSTLVDQKLELVKSDNEEVTKWNEVKALLDGQFEPYATCEEINKIYSRKFKQSPDDTVLLKKITRLLDLKDCTDSELFFEATENLHKAKPTGQSAYLMGKLSLIKGDLPKAEGYFTEAIPNLDEQQKAKASYYLANINYEQKRYSEARSYALKSLAINPNDGKCYIMIGNMYAASAATCGTDEISQRAGYWAAVDKFIKARNVDPSVADEANKSIALYSSYFPTRERLFFNDVKEGSSYTVGCWINESTTVRASK
jgi:tetratricopeptide (TPR) repeat protein